MLLSATTFAKLQETETAKIYISNNYNVLFEIWKFQTLFSPYLWTVHSEY